MSSQNVLELTTSNFEQEISSGVTLVDFWATWCGPCRMIAPIVDEIADANAGSVKVGKVNVDEQPDLAARFSVASIPTLVILKDGREVSRMVGARPKAQIQMQIDAAK